VYKRQARILPAKKIAEIGPDGLKRLWGVIPWILRGAINNGGYIEEKYAQWDNRSGGQIPHFKIYDRGGEPCSVCGNPISETKLNGRWTYFCPTCQH
jgi:formamidopyrimidine-DNA glycosylase